MPRAISSSCSRRRFWRSSSISRAFSTLVEISIAKACNSAWLPSASRSSGFAASMYSTPSVSSFAEITLVSWSSPIRMRKIGMHSAAREASAAPTPCVRSTLIANRSERCSSASAIRASGSSSLAGPPRSPDACRATLTSKRPLASRSSRNARSARAIDSAASTTASKTSSTPLASSIVRATSSTAESRPSAPVRRGPAPISETCLSSLVCGLRASQTVIA